MEKSCDFAGCNHCGDPGTCRLNQLGVGCRGSVVSVGGDPEIRRRLLEGLDDIGVTFAQLERIDAYEREHEPAGPLTTAL